MMTTPRENSGRSKYGLSARSLMLWTLTVVIATGAVSPPVLVIDAQAGDAQAGRAVSGDSSDSGGCCRARLGAVSACCCATRSGGCCCSKRSEAASEASDDESLCFRAGNCEIPAATVAATDVQPGVFDALTKIPPRATARLMAAQPRPPGRGAEPPVPPPPEVVL